MQHHRQARDGARLGLGVARGEVVKAQLNTLVDGLSNLVQIRVSCRDHRQEANEVFISRGTVGGKFGVSQPSLGGEASLPPHGSGDVQQSNVLGA